MFPGRTVPSTVRRPSGFPGPIPLAPFALAFDAHAIDVLENALTLWEMFPEANRATIEAVAMDMWQASENAPRRLVPGVKIVHDKFHIAKHLNDGFNRVRTEEHRRLLREGDDQLKGDALVVAAGRRQPHRRPIRKLPGNQGRGPENLHGVVYQGSFLLLRGGSEVLRRSGGILRGMDRHTIYSKLEPMEKVAKMLKEGLGNVVP